VTRFELRDGQWTYMGSLAVDSESAANFGSAIVVRGDKAYVGAPGWNESQGAVLQFRRNAGNWELNTRISLGNGEAGDRFGSGIGFSGDDLWIGAPTMREYLTGSVYVYEANPDGTLSYSPRRVRLENTVERDAFG